MMRSLWLSSVSEPFPRGRGLARTDSFVPEEEAALVHLREAWAELHSQHGRVSHASARARGRSDLLEMQSSRLLRGQPSQGTWCSTQGTASVSHSPCLAILCRCKVVEGPPSERQCPVMAAPTRNKSQKRSWERVCASIHPTSMRCWKKPRPQRFLSLPTSCHGPLELRSSHIGLQVEIHEPDQPKTHFVFDGAHYVIVRGPFGIKHFTSAFQHIMEYMFHGRRLFQSKTSNKTIKQPRADENQQYDIHCLTSIFFFYSSKTPIPEAEFIPKQFP